MSTITPCLWFDNNIQEAIDHYQDVFPNTRVDSVNRSPDGGIFTAEFEIEGQRFMALNGGPQFSFTEAISFFVVCETQAEVDRYWDMLTSNGGEESQCGWLKDRFGLSWQIVPRAFMEMMQGPPEKSQRAMNAMLQMRKLDVPTLRQAYDGAVAAR